MTVIEFRRPDKQPPRGEDEWRYTVHIYQNPVEDTTGLDIRFPDGPDIDFENFLDTLTRALWHGHSEQFDQSKDPDHDLLLITKVYRSSLVSSRWMNDPDKDNGFETPEQLRWLRDRLIDAYWQVDESRGLRWRLHDLTRRAQRAWRQMSWKRVIETFTGHQGDPK